MSRTVPNPTPSVHPLRARRDARRLSLRTLARLSGITYIKLHYYEHGLEIPTVHQIKLAQILHCEPSDLVPGGGR